MNVTLAISIRRLIIFSSALAPAIDVVGQGYDVPLVPASSSSGNASGAGDDYDDGTVYSSYQSQSAYQSSVQRAAANDVLQNTVGYSAAAPFGPRISLDGVFGDRMGVDGNDYSVSAFMPWHLDPGRNLMFAVARGTSTDLGDFVGNFGVGQRMFFDDLNRIIGVSGWFDIDDSHNQVYYRAGAQIEYIGRYMEVRGGVDLVVQDDRKLLSSGFTGEAPFFRVNNIVSNFFTVNEFAYDQGYLEAGGPLPYIGRYGVNGYAGSYFMWHKDDEEAVGVSGRISADLTRDLAVSFRYTNDQIFGSNSSVNVSLSLPAGGIKQIFRTSPRALIRGQSPDGNVAVQPNRIYQPRQRSVASRMGDNVVREMRMPVLIKRNVFPVPEINPLDGMPFFVSHVDPNATGVGNGTFETPFTTLEAARRANVASVDIIRVIPNSDGSGSDLAVLAPFGLFNNQRLLASSSPHTFTSVRGVFAFPSPTVVGPGPLVTNSMGGDVIRLANNNEVSGFVIDGSATGNGIAGSPGGVVGFNINRNTIQNGTNGLLIQGASGTGLLDNNTFSANSTTGATINQTGANTLNLLITNNMFTGNGTGLVVGAANGGTVNAVVSDNSFIRSTDTNSGFRAISDAATLNLLSVIDNRFTQNIGQGMLLAALNGGVLTSIGEDEDGDGLLGATEDLNANGILDLGIARNIFEGNTGIALAVRGGEDVNRNNILDLGEDLNGNNVLDSGVGVDVNLDIGGSVASLGNLFGGNLGGSIAFDMQDTSLTTTRIRHNTASLTVSTSSQPQDLIFVIDISGSTFGSFGGTPVGDLNSDGNSDTVLDAEIAGFIALNQSLINAGTGNSSRVALVAFESVAFGRDMDPAAAGTQLVTNPLTDADANSVRDVDQALMAEMSTGGTDFEAALQEAIITFNAVPLTPNNTTLVFLSDGQGFGSGITDEVATLQGLGVNSRAFGIGMGASLAQLQIIDPNASVVTNTDDLLTVLSSIIVSAPLTGDVGGIRLTLADTARLRPSIISNNDISAYPGVGIEVETFNGALVDDLTISSNIVTGIGADGVRLAAANTSLIDLTDFSNNVITGSGENGARIEALNAARVSLAGITGNTFSTNTGNGFSVRANGLGAVVVGGIGIGNRVPNTFASNSAAGIAFEASGGGRIAGPANIGNFRVANNFIGTMGAGNALGGIDAVVDSNMPLQSVLNLTVGGSDSADANTFIDNMDAGIAFRTLTSGQGLVVIRNNVITGTTDNTATANPTDPMGDGIYLNREGTSLMTAFVLDNLSTGNAGSGLRAQASGDDPTSVLQPMMGTPNTVTFDRNIFSMNMGHGVAFQVLADASLVANGTLNTITNNTLDGIHVATSQNAGFGDPGTATFSVFDGNTITDNMDDGVEIVSTGGSRVFLSIQSSDAVGLTSISNNMGDGVAINHTSTSASNIIIQSDPILANNMFTTNIATNGNTATGGNGVNITNAAGSSIFTVQRTNITGSVADTMGNGGDGIQLNSTGGAAIFNIGSPVVGGAIMTSGLGNLVQNNTGDGVGISIAASSPTMNFGENVIGARVGELGGGNMGNGFNVAVSGAFAPVLNFVANQVTRNVGRGANIQLTGTLGTPLPFRSAGQFNFLNGNVIASNGLEGIFYSANPGVLQNRTVTLSNTDELIVGDNDLTPAFWDNRLRANPPLFYNDAFRNLIAQNNSILRIVNNTIQSNGTRNTDTDMIGGVDGDGVYIRVATNSYVAADVQGNSFGGNLQDDFRTESFATTDEMGNAIMATLSVDRTGAGTVDSIVLRDTAQLDLRFGLAGNINTGNFINVTSAGIMDTADPLSGATSASFFQVDNGPGLNLGPNSINNFVQFGVTQDINAAFTAGGYFLRAAADGAFPNAAFPVGLLSPPNPPAPFLP